MIASEWTAILNAWDWILGHRADGLQIYQHAAWYGFYLRYFLDGLAYWCEGVPRLHESIKAAQELRNPELAFRFPRHYGILLRNIGELGKAVQVHKENIAFTKNDRTHRLRGCGKEQLGQTLLWQGELDAAEQQFSLAHKIACSPKGESKYAPSTLSCLGEVNLRRRKLEQAKRCFQEALTRYPKQEATWESAALWPTGRCPFRAIPLASGGGYYARAAHHIYSVLGWVDVKGAAVLCLGRVA